MGAIKKGKNTDKKGVFIRGKPTNEVADILRKNWKWIESSGKFTAHQQRMLHALTLCRTAALGGHMDACTACGVVRISYNSCRNRHCPKCQNVHREKWILSREEDLLPVPYFHVVFTLPAALNRVAIRHPQVVYDTLFRAAWATLKTFGADPKHLGAKVGMTAVLHTWGQNLSLHPHLHCIVPGGGLDALGRWKTAKSEGKFLFPVKAMSLVFRSKYVALLRSALATKNIKLSDEYGLFQSLFAKRWVIYAKRPFATPGHVVEYLGRYSHKIAISNHRIKGIGSGKTGGDKVTIGYKDYRVGGAKKELVLDQQEFIRRFALHILPSGFMRIRHYGFLASGQKKKNLAAARKSLAAQGKTLPAQPKTRITTGTTWEEIAKKRLGFDVKKCTSCGAHAMVKVTILYPEKKDRAPPLYQKNIPEIVLF